MSLCGSLIAYATEPLLLKNARISLWEWMEDYASTINNDDPTKWNEVFAGSPSIPNDLFFSQDFDFASQSLSAADYRKAYRKMRNDSIPRRARSPTSLSSRRR